MKRDLHMRAIRPTQSVICVPLQVNRFQKSILLIVQYKYSKSCSEVLSHWFSAQDHVVLRLFLNIVGFFISAWQKSAKRKSFVPQLYQLRKGFSQGPALKYFFMIHKGGRIHADFIIPVCCDSTKETQLYGKRPIHTNTDLSIRKETHTHDSEKRSMSMQRNPTNCIHSLIPVRAIGNSVAQKRPNYTKRDPSRQIHSLIPVRAIADKQQRIQSKPHCNTLQHTATHCNTLQHTATHCNTLCVR